MSQRSETGTTYDPNAIEQNVTTIWKEVLELPEISKEIHFNDLGGDSLAAMACIARMRKLWNIELTIEDFFLEDSTIVGFTKMVNQYALNETRSDAHRAD